MNDIRIAITSAALFLVFGVSSAVAQDYDKSFLPDHSKLQATPLPNNMGTDLVYLSPAVLPHLARYTAAVVDEPEVLISPNSDYKGAKPTDLMAISALVREDVSVALEDGGYGVVDAPGPSVLYLTMAVTDLSLKRTKRHVLAYTPVGFLVKTGVDATRDMMQKYDIVGATIQAQILDSISNEVIAEFVALRGNNGKRMDFKEFDAQIKSFASRLRCRLDNAHAPIGRQIDCLDPAARHAREATHSEGTE